MLTGKGVKGYLDTIVRDIDAGKKPQRPTSPWWVRKLAIPAAFGLSLGLAGCTGGETEPNMLDKDEAAQGKEDGFTDTLCEWIGAEPGCDLCDELGWYGDGVCDDFCDEPDPDCGATALYAAPMDENCTDGADNDFDGDIDCDDSDCSLHEDCVAVAL